MIYYSNRILWRLLLHSHGSSIATSSTLSRAAVVAALSTAVVALQRKKPTLFPPEALDHLLLSASTFLAVLVGLRLFAALHQWQKGENKHGIERCNVVGSANKMRAAIVELWLRRAINRARRKSYVTVEQAMELNKILSILPQMYTRIFNLSNVPITFNLAQFLYVCFVGFLLLMAATLASEMGFMTSLYVGIAAVLLFAVDNVASSIECPFGMGANDVDLEARILCIQDELKTILQAHFHSVGHINSFKEQDRMASLSSLLSVDVETVSRGRTRHESVSSSYSSKERSSQYTAPSSTSATDRAVLLSIQPDAYGAIAEDDDELAMHGSDDHPHIAV
ncbi:unnamed protein product [Peronospora destructor]|uniref:Uncharacterized protein n=1 Tax=Peronospora destructor TaxID=86335 RepID=A0AAV0UTW3_9STRA|nr:unnamed protein product [Peronospora destructor]